MGSAAASSALRACDEDERGPHVLTNADTVPKLVPQRKLRVYAIQWLGVSVLSATCAITPHSTPAHVPRPAADVPD